MVREAWCQQANLQHALHPMDLCSICRQYPESRRHSCWVENSNNHQVGMVAAWEKNQQLKCN